MMRTLRIATLSLASALASCNWGTRPNNFGPAQTAAGAMVAVRVRTEPTDRRGELMAVDTTGIILVSQEQQLVRIAWRRIDAMDVDKLGADFDIPYGQQADAAKRRRLALVSRFPQGLSGDLIARTLELLHQASIQEIK